MNEPPKTVADQGEPGSHGNTSGAQASNSLPKPDAATTPSEQKEAEDHNGQVLENRERYIYRPLRHFLCRPIVRAIDTLNRNSGAIVAVATVVIAWLTISLSYDSARQADTAKTADQTTRESFTAVQRAFVFGKELIVQYDTSIMNYWRFAVRVVNSGNTPTQRMDYLTVSDRANPIDPDDVFKITPKYVYGVPPSIIQRRSGDILGPHDDFILVGSETGVPAGAIIQMAAVHQPYVVRGVIHYRDVFTGTAEHITKFCFIATPYKDRQETKVSVQRCLYWNCADEDCKDDRERYDHDIAVLNPSLKKLVPAQP